MKQIRLALLYAGLILGVAFLMSHADWFGFTEPAEQRTTGVVTGIILAWFGNLMPKQGPNGACRECGTARGQDMRRFAGWMFLLAGLGHALVWLVAPLEQANYLAMGIIAAALGLVIGRATISRTWV